jgi:hypothetical protein
MKRNNGLRMLAAQIASFLKNNTTKRLTLALVVAVTFLAMTASASAESLKAFATRAGNETGTNTHFLVDLDNSSHTSLAFSTSTTNSLIKITYNAECGVLGPPESWLSVTILVDGVQANPASGAFFGFCTSLPNGRDYQWTGATRQSLIRVPNIGTHFVQVVVDINYGATNWWLGDSSIVVEQQ